MENRETDVGRGQADTSTEDTLAEVQRRDVATAADHVRQTGLESAPFDYLPYTRTALSSSPYHIHHIGTW